MTPYTSLVCCDIGELQLFTMNSKALQYYNVSLQYHSIKAQAYSANVAGNGLVFKSLMLQELILES